MIYVVFCAMIRANYNSSNLACAAGLSNISTSVPVELLAAGVEKHNELSLRQRNGIETHRFFNECTHVD